MKQKLQLMIGLFIEGFINFLSFINYNYTCKIILVTSFTKKPANTVPAYRKGGARLTNIECFVVKKEEISPIFTKAPKYILVNRTINQPSAYRFALQDIGHEMNVFRENSMGGNFCKHRVSPGVTSQEPVHLERGKVRIG